MAVNIITVYIEPKNKPKAIKAISSLEHILSLILDRIPKSMIIVSRVFNEHREKIEKIGLMRGLSPSILTSPETHN